MTWVRLTGPTAIFRSSPLPLVEETVPIWNRSGEISFLLCFRTGELSLLDEDEEGDGSRSEEDAEEDEDISGLPNTERARREQGQYMSARVCAL